MDGLKTSTAKMRGNKLIIIIKKHIPAHYTAGECKKIAEQSARSKIAGSLKEPYVEAVNNNNTAKMGEIRTFMINSGYYQSRKKNGTAQSVVDETLRRWREGNQTNKQRESVAEERAKNYK